MTRRAEVKRLEMMGFRCSEDLRAAIERAAEEHRRTLSSEIEERIRLSFEREAQR